MRVFNLTIGAIRLRFYVIIAISTLIAIVLATSADTVRADGITWTTRTYPVDNRWISVTCGGPTGEEKFVAVASSGTGDRVMTSPDGITWTTQTSAADNEWTQVAWGGPTGQQKFVAVANSGTGDRVMTSGLTVSTPSAPTINSITSGDGSLIVSFTAAADGGSPITNYKYSTDGVTYSALNPASTSSPFTISGLANGTTYSVTIKAVNAIGDSVASNIFASTTTTPTTTVVPEVTAPTTVPTEEKAQSLPVTGDDSTNIVFISLFLVIGGIVFNRLRRVI